jgi:hypothetical protein
LVGYLQEQLGAASDVLYLLERYVRRVEWFDRARLWEEYHRDKVRGEALYDRDLRRFLFEQGIDYPFSRPASASGEADIIADLSTDDPLVCEVKLFNAGSYGRSYIGKGSDRLCPTRTTTARPPRTSSCSTCRTRSCSFLPPVKPASGPRASKLRE